MSGNLNLFGPCVRTQVPVQINSVLCQKKYHPGVIWMINQLFVRCVEIHRLIVSRFSSSFYRMYALKTHVRPPPVDIVSCEVWYWSIPGRRWGAVHYCWGKLVDTSGWGSLTVALERDWFVLMCSVRVTVFVTTVIESLLSFHLFIALAGRYLVCQPRRDKPIKWKRMIGKYRNAIIVIGRRYPLALLPQ